MGLRGRCVPRPLADRHGLDSCLDQQDSAFGAQDRLHPGRLAMPYCPYLNQDLGAEAQFSDDHIVPFAIGGSDVFTTRVSKAANDRLGDGPDGTMVNSFFMTFERLKRNLRSTSGNLPELRADGTAEIDGVMVKFSVTDTTADSRIELQSRVHPVHDAGGKPARFVVADNEAEAKEILEKIAKRRGRDGQAPVDVNSALARARMVEVADFTTVHSIKVDACERAFAKMALATGHRVLGERFSRSPDAELIRRFMWEGTVDPAAVLQATFVSIPEAPSGYFGPMVHGEDHVLGIACFGRTDAVFFAILFGTFNAVVRLGPAAPYPQLMGGRGPVFVIDPTSRAMTQYTFNDYWALVTSQQ